MDSNFDENDADFQQIYCAEEQQPNQQYFVDDNQQQDVDELNYGMEMELDHQEIE